MLDLTSIAERNDAAQTLRNCSNRGADADEFPQHVVELQDYFSDAPRQQVRAVPGQGVTVPLWLFGLPYAFASHFAPPQMMQAVALW